MTPPTRRAVLAGAFAVAFAPRARAQAGPVRVVASMTILADFVRNVGGERVAVSSLVGVDGDAHAYQPTPADGRMLAAARLVVLNGLGLEGAGFSRLLRASGYRGARIEAADGTAILMRGRGRQHGGGSDAGVPDPHAWQNVRNAEAYARNIAGALARIDVGGAAAYESGGGRYAQRMHELDAWVRQRIGSVAAEKRRVVTTHDAFGHFGAAYGVEFLAAQGVSSESEPSARQVARLVAQARREGVRALFIENMTSPRIIEQIARELGAPLGGTLYADSLSAPDGPAATYEAMIRHNAEALVAGMMRN